jgi:phosphoribosylamine--glycine ligase
MVVIGPEGPLVAGLTNDLVKAGIPTFGPSSEAAALEGSKDFMKKLCDKYNIPTAQVLQFTFLLSTAVFQGLQGFDSLR